MLYPLLIGSFVIITCVVIQACGNVIWLKQIAKNYRKGSKVFSPGSALRLLNFSFLFFTVLHVLQTCLWALTYILIPATNEVFTSFTEAWYFSLITFTSLGYGDLTLGDNWRLLSGIEAINGIMLIGWSTAMMFSLIQQLYQSLKTD